MNASRIIAVTIDDTYAEDNCDAVAEIILATLRASGYMVVKLPERTTPETVPFRFADKWHGIQDGASEEHLDFLCNGFADGWNACLDEMLGEEK